MAYNRIVAGSDTVTMQASDFVSIGDPTRRR